MKILKEIFDALNNRVFKICFFGAIAAAAFILGERVVAHGYRESWLAYIVLLGAIATLFFAAIGEFASNIGNFSAIGYVIVTFFAALTCYVISPVWQALNVTDPTSDDFLETINGGYVGYAYLYAAAYILTLLLGFVIHRKDILVKKEA